MSNQTLAAGSTPSQRYGRLRGFSGTVSLHPARLMSYWIGFPGSGKSAMLQEIEDSYHFNLDLASTTAHTPRHIYFPGFDPITQRTTDEDGKPLVLTYAEIIKRCEMLVDMAQKNETRPATIVFDSLTAMLRLCIDHLVVNSQQVGLSQAPVTFWHQLNGKAAWDWVYSEIVDRLCSLRDAGYGVAVVGHLANARQQVGENQYAIRPESVITDGFWKRLYNIFELVAYVYTEKKRVTTVRELKSMVGGRELVDRRNESHDVDAFYVTVTRMPDLQGLTKSRTRTPMPDKLEIPQPGAWQTFVDAYIKSNQ